MCPIGVKSETRGFICIRVDREVSLLEDKCVVSMLKVPGRVLKFIHLGMSIYLLKVPTVVHFVGVTVRCS